MAQGYKLVEKKNLGRDAAEQPTKVYAIPKYNGYTDMDTLCKMIGARSTVSSADVKAVLDNLNFVLDMELQAGRIVQLGEFGNFRLSLSSEGANDMEGFDRSMIVGARVIFTPGASLKKTLKTTNFASYTEETTATGTDDEENGGTPGGV